MPTYIDGGDGGRHVLMAEMAAGVYLLGRWRPASIDGGGRLACNYGGDGGRHEVIADNDLDDAGNSLANISIYVCMYSLYRDISKRISRII